MKLIISLPSETQFLAHTDPADTRCRCLRSRNALVDRVSTRAFERLPKSELLGTNQDEKKVGEICDIVKKYLIQLKQIN